MTRHNLILKARKNSFRCYQQIDGKVAKRFARVDEGIEMGQSTLFTQSWNVQWNQPVRK